MHSSLHLDYMNSSEAFYMLIFLSIQISQPSNKRRTWKNWYDTPFALCSIWYIIAIPCISFSSPLELFFTSTTFSPFVFCLYYFLGPLVVKFEVAIFLPSINFHFLTNMCVLGGNPRWGVGGIFVIVSVCTK